MTDAQVRERENGAYVGDDLDIPLWGARQIGAVIGLNEEQCAYRLGKGQLPASKIGSTYISTKRKLLRGIVGA
jgi:hypothetical protein